MTGNYFVSINMPIEFSEGVFESLNRKLIDKCLIGKYTPIQNYHLTLRFFGDIPISKVEELRDKLRDIDFENFNLRIGRLGFLKKGFGGILWVEFTSPDLKRLVKEIWGKVGWEKRKFKSHLTLFRAKKILDEKKLFDYVKKGRFDVINFNVDRFNLMKSELLPEGAEYNIVEEFKSRETIQKSS